MSTEETFPKSLREGDRVIVSGRNRERITKVDKVTPTGLIKIGADTFNSRGQMRGADVWYPVHLVEATDENVDRIRRHIWSGRIRQLGLEELQRLPAQELYDFHNRVKSVQP